MLRLIRFLKPYKGKLALTVLILLAQTLAELYLPTLMADVVNNGMMKGDTAYIWRFGSYMLVVALLSSIWAIVASYYSSVIGMSFGRDIRNSVFARIESYSLHEFDKIGTASLITRTTNDINQMQTVVVMGLRFIVSAPLMCLGGVFMAYSKDPRLTLLLAGVLPLMIVGIALIARTVVPLFKAMQKKLDQVNLVLRENLTGIRVIRAFDRLASETRRFKTANRDLADNAIKVNKIMAAMNPMMMIFLNLTSVAIVWFGGLRIAQDNLLIGDMMAFLQYAMQIMFSLIMVTMMFMWLPRAEASAQRINEVLEMEPDIVDPTDATPPPTMVTSSDATMLPTDVTAIDAAPAPAMVTLIDVAPASSMAGQVEFRAVSFSYPGAGEPVLRDITFVARPGEVTAIIGGTGSGKSTLINLIPRFYDVDHGQVLVDGVDVRQLTQENLRCRIGFVPQTPILFSGTVAENIRYGKREASDSEVRHAAAVAQAEEFIRELSAGYDAPIAQRGANLSGGQKQRLSIARALVRRPSIYIFDDSFSALDFKTEARLRAALKQETAQSTVIIVAQRVTTVMDADQILVLDQGQMVGLGTHRQLLDECEIYREIVLSQLSAEEIA